MKSDGWDPDLPLTSSNHPPCEYCDLGIETSDCTCFDYQDENEVSPCSK
jgi:hypothetical protein